jgi:transcriptional regulator with XRE-family HTH domain
MGFKENLKQLRKQKGWTQVQAAEQAGVPFRTLQNWETGSREPRLVALKKLAAAFVVTADELLTDDKPVELPRPKRRTMRPKKPR